MIFTFGIIVGLLIAILVIVTVLYFKKIVEHKFEIMGKQIAVKGPRPKGFIFEPADEATEAREEIIAENKRKGIDTKLSDLQ